MLMKIQVQTMRECNNFFWFHYTGGGFDGLGPMLSVLLREISQSTIFGASLPRNAHQSHWKCHAILVDFDIFVWRLCFAPFFCF